MKNIFGLVIVSFFLAITFGCGRGKEPSAPEAPLKTDKPQSETKSSGNAVESTKYSKIIGKEKAQENTTGVGDVVDYFTGSKPLEIKKKKEIELKKIQERHNKDLQREIDKPNN